MGVIADGGRGLLRGCHWGAETRFAVLDIDAGSPYHNPESLNAIAGELQSIGLKFVPYQSSDSGGWHLYLPFDRWQRSNEVEHQLKQWFKKLGYQIKGGKLEIFPSGNALRLPLQPGFAWLGPAGELVRRREDLTADDALAAFMSDMNTHSCSWSEAKAGIEQQVQERKLVVSKNDRLSTDGFEHVYSAGRIDELWHKGRRWWKDGLLKNGERHDAVLAVGHYLWYGDPDRFVPALPGARNDEYRALLIEQWLNQKHNGKCRHIREGNWGIVQDQIRRAVSWRKGEVEPRQPYPLTSRLLKRLVGIYKKTGNIYTIEQFAEANLQRKMNARERIHDAIISLRREGAKVISLREVARRAGAHWKTVQKNQDLLISAAGVNNLGGSAPLDPQQALDRDLKAKPEIESVFVLEAEAAVVCLNGSLTQDSDVSESANFVLPPALSCLANEPITCSHSKDQEALRVAAQVLTPAPNLRALQAVLQEGAGGTCSNVLAFARILPEMVKPGASAKCMDEASRVSMSRHMPRRRKRKTGTILGRFLLGEEQRFSDFSDTTDIPRRLPTLTELARGPPTTGLEPLLSYIY